MTRSRPRSSGRAWLPCRFVDFQDQAFVLCVLQAYLGFSSFFRFFSSSLRSLRDRPIGLLPSLLAGFLVSLTPLKGKYGLAIVKINITFIDVKKKNGFWNTYP